jgi:hypothetical protein
VLLAFGQGAYDAAAGYDVWLLGDGSTWTYAHGAWSNITSSAGVPARMPGNSLLVYDARDGYPLLFGGAIGPPEGRPLADTWGLEGGQWTNLTGTVHGSPPPMIPGTMTYDSTDQKVVLFGGSRVNATPPYLYALYPMNETWTYAGGAWTNATVPGPVPLGGSYGGNPFLRLVDDPADGYLLYYDGIVGPPHFAPITWTYSHGVWTNRTATFPPAPQLLFFAGIGYDSTSRAVLGVGTCTWNAAVTCVHHFGGTFAFSNGTWKDVTPSTSPPPREESSFVDDPSDGGMVLVGGCCWADFSGLSLYWQDAWIYSDGRWTETHPWGGGAPTFFQNDGSWVAVALALSAAGSIALVQASRRSPKP